MDRYIAIVDYGAGNLFSMKNALDYIGARSIITSEPEALERSAAVLLPGVGAFPDAMNKLRAAALTGALCASARRKPFLGICLGMQVLFELGTEFSETPGLGLLPGRVVRLQAAGLPVPHMGWNSLHLNRPDDPLLAGVREGDFVYYVHSFYATGCGEALAASSDYGGVTVAGAVRRGSVCGTQFHPEKSGAVGLRILRAFAMGEGDAAC